MGKEIARKDFRSSYGHFDLRVVDVTGDGIEEMVLITGRGRGTQARIETLEVWQRSADSFTTILAVTVSDYWGVGRSWWYEPQFVDRDGDGIIDLELVLRMDPVPAPGDDASELPRAGFLHYVFDRQDGTMKLYNRGKRK